MTRKHPLNRVIHMQLGLDTTKPRNQIARDLSRGGSVAIWRTLLCLASMLCALGSAQAGALPPAFEARYEVHVAGLYAGQGILSLKPVPDGGWLFTVETQPEGLAALLAAQTTDRSELELSDAQARPIRYTQSEGKDRQTQLDAGFDWVRREVSVTDSSGQRAIPLPPGPIQDRASVYPALMAALEANSLPEQVQLFDGKRVKTYALALHPGDVLDTAVGRLDTVRVQRGVEGDKRISSFWCAPALDYLPVKVIKTKRGQEILRLTLLSVTGLGKP